MSSNSHNNHGKDENFSTNPSTQTTQTFLPLPPTQSLLSALTPSIPFIPSLHLPSFTSFLSNTDQSSIDKGDKSGSKGENDTKDTKAGKYPSPLPDPIIPSLQDDITHTAKYVHHNMFITQSHLNYTPTYPLDVEMPKGSYLVASPQGLNTPYLRGTLVVPDNTNIPLLRQTLLSASQHQHNVIHYKYPMLTQNYIKTGQNRFIYESLLHNLLFPEFDYPDTRDKIDALSSTHGYPKLPSQLTPSLGFERYDQINFSHHLTYGTEGLNKSLRRDDTTTVLAKDYDVDADTLQILSSQNDPIFNKMPIFGLNVPTVVITQYNSSPEQQIVKILPYSALAVGSFFALKRYTTFPRSELHHYLAQPQLSPIGLQRTIATTVGFASKLRSTILAMGLLPLVEIPLVSAVLVPLWGNISTQLSSTTIPYHGIADDVKILTTSQHKNQFLRQYHQFYDFPNGDELFLEKGDFFDEKTKNSEKNTNKEKNEKSEKSNDGPNAEEKTTPTALPIPTETTLTAPSTTLDNDITSNNTNPTSTRTTTTSTPTEKIDQKNEKTEEISQKNEKNETTTDPKVPKLTLSTSPPLEPLPPFPGITKSQLDQIINSRPREPTMNSYIPLFSRLLHGFLKNQKMSQFTPVKFASERLDDELNTPSSSLLSAGLQIPTASAAAVNVTPWRQATNLERIMVGSALTLLAGRLFLSKQMAIKNSSLFFSSNIPTGAASEYSGPFAVIINPLLRTMASKRRLNNISKQQKHPLQEQQKEIDNTTNTSISPTSLTTASTTSTPLQISLPTPPNAPPPHHISHLLQTGQPVRHLVPQLYPAFRFSGVNLPFSKMSPLSHPTAQKLAKKYPYVESEHLFTASSQYSLSYVDRCFAQGQAMVEGATRGGWQPFSRAARIAILVLGMTFFNGQFTTEEFVYEDRNDPYSGHYLYDIDAARPEKKEEVKGHSGASNETENKDQNNGQNNGQNKDQKTNLTETDTTSDSTTPPDTTTNPTVEKDIEKVVETTQNLEEVIKKSQGLEKPEKPEKPREKAIGEKAIEKAHALFTSSNSTPTTPTTAVILYLYLLLFDITTTSRRGYNVLLSHPRTNVSLELSRWATNSDYRHPPTKAFTNSTTPIPFQDVLPTPPRIKKLLQPLLQAVQGYREPLGVNGEAKSGTRGWFFNKSVQKVGQKIRPPHAQKIFMLLPIALTLITAKACLLPSHDFIKGNNNGPHNYSEELFAQSVAKDSVEDEMQAILNLLRHNGIQNIFHKSPTVDSMHPAAAHQHHGTNSSDKDGKKNDSDDGTVITQSSFTFPPSTLTQRIPVSMIQIGYKRDKSLLLQAIDEINNQAIKPLKSWYSSWKSGRGGGGKGGDEGGDE